jgi:hypothetical protein
LRVIRKRIADKEASSMGHFYLKEVNSKLGNEAALIGDVKISKAATAACTEWVEWVE